MRQLYFGAQRHLPQMRHLRRHDGVFVKIASTNETSLADYALVEQGVVSRVTDTCPRGKAFIRFVLYSHFGVPDEEIDYHIVDGGEDRGIDAIYVDHENKTINICSCKCVSSLAKSKKNFPGAEIDKLISVMDDIFYHRDSVLGTVNGGLASFIREIWELLSSGDIWTTSICLFSNQLTLDRNERDRFIAALGRHNVALEEHGLYQLVHGVVQHGKLNFRKRLEPASETGIPFAEGDIRTLLIRVPLKQIAEFCTNNGAFDNRLIDTNLRYFLGAANEVNRAIEESLKSGKLAHFFAKNNGITIVCEKLITVNSSFPINMQNPKIVNGGQTARVLYNVFKDQIDLLEGGYIFVKIVETRDAQLANEICIASNNQSRIFGRDMRAHDEFQIKLAAGLHPLGYFYKRKRGEKNPDPDHLVEIDSIRAGQLLLCYLKFKPTLAKTNSNDIFDSEYEQAFDRSLVEPRVIVTVYKCYLVLEKMRREAHAWQRSMSKDSYNESWVIEGYLHVIAIVGELMRRKHFDLGDTQNALLLLPEALNIVGRVVERNSRIAMYRLFRIQKTEASIIEAIDDSLPVATSPLQLPLPI